MANPSNAPTAVMSSASQRWGSALCLLVVVATGCRDTAPAGAGVDTGADAGTDTGADQAPVARWQPPNGPMPEPTDYWRSTDGERLVPPTDGELNPAERVYRRYLTGLDGYPQTVDVRFPIDGELDSETVADGVVGIDRSQWSTIETDTDWASEAGALHVSPADAMFGAGRQYAIALRGGTDGIAGPEGAELTADEPFELVRGDREVDADAWSERAARRIRTRRESYGPVFDVLADEQGLDRESVAGMTQFRISSRAAVWFDPGSGRMPVPNDYRFDREEAHVEVPDREGASDEASAIRRALSEYDGFSTSAPMFAPTTGPVDARSFERSQAFRLFRKRESGWHAVEEYRRGVTEDRETLWAEPTPALAPDARYAYLVTDALQTRAGRSIRAQPTSALLRNDAALVDGEGQSRLAIFDDGQAEKLEWLRSRVGGLTGRLASEGLSRESIAAVVPFRTMDVLDNHLRRRARLYEDAVPTSVTDTEAKSPLERGLLVAMPRVETVVTGRMTTLDFLDPKTTAFRGDGNARERNISFVLTLPEGYETGAEIPVVLFGHGLTTSRELVYLIADRLAEAGYAAFSIDLPYHGGRSICEADRHCRGDATCSDRGVCRESDGSRGQLRRVEAPDWLWDESPRYPISSGRSFIDLDDLVATRDHFAQALVDVMQGLRVVRGADWREASGGYRLDGDDVVYVGVSLGGILGANLTAVEPTLEDFALNVPGGDVVEMIEHSEAFRGRYRQELDERGLEPGTDAFRRFVHRAHWLLDPVDPMNLGRYATERTMRYRKPGTDRMVEAGADRVLIQMAKGDSVVPNVSTEILADRMNRSISVYEPNVAGHGFVFSPTSIEGNNAREEIVEFFEQR